MSDISDSLFFSLAFLIALTSGILLYLHERKRDREASARVHEAEREAFKDHPERLSRQLDELSRSQESLEERAQDLSRLLDESRSAVAIGSLFNLFSRQIEKYQDQTRSRANWSFVFAIFSMFSGLGFVIWGGSVLLKAEKPIVLAAGGILASLGGAISAFIAKSFLDVHKISLNQLNRYFRQPVLNDHIVMAQRLADEIGDEEFRRKSYEKIIQSVTALIRIDEDANDA